MDLLKNKFLKKKQKKELKEIKKKIENIEEESKKSKLEEILERFYYYLPEKYRSIIEYEAKYAGTDNYASFTIAIMFATFMSLVGFPIYLIWLGVPWYYATIPLIFGLISAVFLPYFALSLAAESRRKRIEQYLPDFLILASSNIKSGLTIDRALLFASRPEFGELSELTKRASYEIYGGKDIDEALLELSSKIKSQIFKKTISLLIEGLRSGGAIATLLEEAANDIRNTKILQKEIKGTVVMYVMFIFFAGVVAAPGLFAVSVFLIDSTTGMWQGDTTLTDIAKEYQVMSFISMSKPQVDIQKFEIFAVVSLLVTTLFSGILISMIQYGNARNAIKYSPTFMVLAILIYYGVKAGLYKMFGSLM